MTKAEAIKITGLKGTEIGRRLGLHPNSFFTWKKGVPEKHHEAIRGMAGSGDHKYDEAKATNGKKRGRPTGKKAGKAKAVVSKLQFQEVLPPSVRGKTIIIITDDQETIANIIQGA
jgi:hypothetical protein